MKAAIMLLLFVTVSFSQTTSYSVLDQYFGDLLYPGKDQNLVSDRVNYPGLERDSTTSVDLGFFNQTFSPPSWNDLYAWGETKIASVEAGMWLGNLDDRYSQYAVIGSSSSYRYLSGGCAFWLFPIKETAFKGISLTMNGLSSGSLSSSNLVEGYYSHMETSRDSSNGFSAAATSMFRLCRDLNFRLSASGAYDKYSYRYREVNVNSEPAYVYGIESATTDSNSENLGVTAGLVDSKDRQINVGCSLSTLNLIRSGYFAADDQYDFSQGSGDLLTFVNMSMGKQFTYMRHHLYVGLYGAVVMDLPFTTNSQASFSDFSRKLRSGNRAAYGQVRSPVVLECNLFNSTVYALARIAPEIDGTYYNITGISTSKSVNFSVGEVSLGLRGKIGDRIEFALMPTLHSDIFCAGLEIKYLLGRGTTLSKK
jgi:hypothetical protein